MASSCSSMFVTGACSMSAHVSTSKRTTFVAVSWNLTLDDIPGWNEEVLY